jgi:hypothetical protein
VVFKCHQLFPAGDSGRRLASSDWKTRLSGKGNAVWGFFCMLKQKTGIFTCLVNQALVRGNFSMIG